MQLSILILLGAVHLGNSYIITTTAFVDVLATSTLTIIGTTSTTPESSSTTLTSSTTLSFVASSSVATNTSLPSLPLNFDSLSALNSLMNLILTVPDNILQEGDQEVIAFYTNVSSCLSNVTSALENAALKLVPEAESIGQEIASDIVPEGSKATSFLGSLTSDIPGALSTAKSVLGSLESDGTSIIHDIPSAAKSIESKITSIAPSIITQAASVFGHATSDAAAIGKGIASALHLPFKPRGGSYKVQPRDEQPENREFPKLSVHSLHARNLSSTISQISTLSACLSSAAQNNTLFNVGNCAFHIAELAAPAAKIAKVRDLIGGAGGTVKIVQTLGNAKDEASLVKIGGNGVLSAFKELSGIGDVIKDCKFLVQ